jgi:hypothetical protein
MVLLYDDFRRDNAGALRAVLRFLDVDEVVPIAVPEANPTVRVRSRYLNRITHREEGWIWRATTTVAKAVMPTRLRADLRRSWRQVIYGAAPAPDVDLMVELRRRFKPEVESISEYLDRDVVKIWGYDRID